MPIPRAALIVISTLTLLAISNASEERKIRRSDLPAEVQAIVNAQSQGATVRGFSAEREDGQTYFKAELEVSGHSKDILIDYRRSRRRSFGRCASGGSSRWTPGESRTDRQCCVQRVLDGCVVEENFSGERDMHLRGKSVSIFDLNAGKWKQTWVDNEGL